VISSSGIFLFFWGFHPNQFSGLHIVLLMLTYYKSQASSRQFGILGQVSPLLNACIKDGVMFIILRSVVPQNLTSPPPLTNLIRLTALLVISRSIPILQITDYPWIILIVILVNTIITYGIPQNTSLEVTLPWVDATTLAARIFNNIPSDGLMPSTYLLLVFLVIVNLHPLLKKDDDLRDVI